MLFHCLQRAVCHTYKNVTPDSQAVLLIFLSSFHCGMSASYLKLHSGWHYVSVDVKSARWQQLYPGYLGLTFVQWEELRQFISISFTVKINCQLFCKTWLWCIYICIHIKGKLKLKCLFNTKHIQSHILPI